MGKRRWVMWQGLVTPSLERCIVTPLEGGFELSGVILQTYDASAYLTRYRIHVDEGWTTQAVEIELENGGRRSLQLTRSPAGKWSKSGQGLPDLEGCRDVDLEWSPSTNTLPIRRLGLEPGASASVTAAWVRFPSLGVEPLTQTYERLTERRYRYRSGAFAAELEVDEDGLVRRYGVNWKAVAVS